MASLEELDQIPVSGNSAGTRSNVHVASGDISDLEDSDFEDSAVAILQQYDFGYDNDNEGVDNVDTVGTSQSTARYASAGYHDSMEQAKVALEQLNEFEYWYNTRYVSANVTGVEYRCHSHARCPHRVKIVQKDAGRGFIRYHLMQKGVHAQVDVDRKQHGIAAAHKSEIDSLIQLGMGAGRIRNLLIHKYVNDPDLLKRIPDVRMIENRKHRLKKKMQGGWEIDNFITVDNWVHPRLCQTREVFDRPDETDFAKMNELIVLERFQNYFDDGGKQVPTLGLIFTSRSLFNNVRKAVQAQGPSLAMSTDGTYRIHCLGWTLVDAGGISVEWENAQHVHRFRPWLYMFVRTECALAYEKMFSTLVTCVERFFDLNVKVATCSIDHCSAIARALKNVWPDVVILSCWEHLLAQARKQRSRLVKKQFYNDRVLPELWLLHKTRSQRQFRTLSKRVIRGWRLAGEKNYADWLEDVYLSPRWERWTVNSSPTPGVLPTQQPIESHHKVIKEVVTAFSKAPTIHVLNSVLPRLLLLDADTLTSGLHAHYCEGPLPKNAVSKATLHLVKSSNHREVFLSGQRDVPSKIIFNSKSSMVHPNNLAGSKVTVERTTTFVASVEGSAGRRTPVQEIGFKFLSLQLVSVNAACVRSMQALELQPTWKIHTINQVRSALRCTCKSFMKSGWVCSHIVASLHLLGKLDLQLAEESIPMRRPPGRPRALVGSLDRDSNFFEPDRLEKLLINEPAAALKWNCIIRVPINGGSCVEDRIGTIGGVHISEQTGVYEWSVVFVHGDVKFLQVDELVAGIVRARDLRRV